jgi:hypothetical protein
MQKLVHVVTGHSPQCKSNATRTELFTRFNNNNNNNKVLSKAWSSRITMNVTPLQQQIPNNTLLRFYGNYTNARKIRIAKPKPRTEEEDDDDDDITELQSLLQKAVQKVESTSTIEEEEVTNTNIIVAIVTDYID